VTSAASEDFGEESYTVSGKDWDHFISAVGNQDHKTGERIVLNMGPQHPSTHGLNRFILTLDGENVTDVRVSVGYLHTGIEKTMEFRTWVQGVTLCTRMDYLSCFFNETAYCLAVERLLGIEQAIPERASVIRVMMMEFNRIASHLLAVGSFGMELGASTIFLSAMRERERILDVFELVTGLRMNHAYIRPGGLAHDLPPGTLAAIGSLLAGTGRATRKLRSLMNANPVYLARTRNVAYLDLAGCMALGVTGPVLRSAALPWDLRKSQPYCGYQNYEFDIPVRDTCDVYGRYLIRMDEIDESVKIVRQCTGRLSGRRPADDPVIVRDAKVAWPARRTCPSNRPAANSAHT
jgi:NADH-quinone oxidoreductase subunit D